MFFYALQNLRAQFELVSAASNVRRDTFISQFFKGFPHSFDCIFASREVRQSKIESLFSFDRMAEMLYYVRSSTEIQTKFMSFWHCLPQLYITHSLFAPHSFHTFHVNVLVFEYRLNVRQCGGHKTEKLQSTIVSFLQFCEVFASSADIFIFIHFMCRRRAPVFIPEIVDGFSFGIPEFYANVKRKTFRIKFDWNAGMGNEKKREIIDVMNCDVCFVIPYVMCSHYYWYSVACARRMCDCAFVFLLLTLALSNA